MNVGVIIYLIIIFSGLASASLGISPAIVDFDYIPGGEYVIDYEVISSDLELEVEIYAVGELREYVSLSKNSMKGPGKFKATIKLPDNIDSPGKNRISIGVRQLSSDQNFIGTAIDISGRVNIFVPYPGKYLEAKLEIPNGNIDAQIPVELFIINRGRETVPVTVEMGFYSGESNVHEIKFNPVILNSTQQRYFREIIDTTGYKPGDYNAKARIYYGEELNINKTFRIGSLFVNIINYTKELSQDEIQKFYVEIESLWNNNLKEVYADVIVINESNNITFRTPSIDLISWSRGNLVGFLDTRGLDGAYPVKIILKYEDQQTFTEGELLIRSNGSKIIYYLIGILVFLAIAGIIIWKKRIIESNKKLLKKGK